MSLDIWLEADLDTGGRRLHCVRLFDANYTHNVIPMWQDAGCYEALYNSEGKTAGEVLPALQAAILDMHRRPEHYRAMDSPNGWGVYARALPWLGRFASACKRHPKARIGVWK